MLSNIDKKYPYEKVWYYILLFLLLREVVRCRGPSMFSIFFISLMILTEAVIDILYQAYNAKYLMEIIVK